jgi:hypothetical protein
MSEGSDSESEDDLKVPVPKKKKFVMPEGDSDSESEDEDLDLEYDCGEQDCEKCHPKKKTFVMPESDSDSESEDECIPKKKVPVPKNKTSDYQTGTYYYMNHTTGMYTDSERKCDCEEKNCEDCYIRIQSDNNESCMILQPRVHIPDESHYLCEGCWCVLKKNGSTRHEKTAKHKRGIPDYYVRMFGICYCKKVDCKNCWGSRITLLKELAKITGKKKLYKDYTLKDLHGMRSFESWRRTMKGVVDL